jgi:hypothetical protein
LSCSPLRQMKSTPAPPPPSLSEPSKYMTDRDKPVGGPIFTTVGTNKG